MARRPKFGHDIHGKDPRDTGNQLWKDIEDKLVGNSHKLADLLSSGNKRGEDLINGLLENYQDNSHLGSGQSVDIGTSRDKNSYAWQDFLNSAGLNNMTDEGFSGLAALLNGYLQNGSPTTERNDMFYQYLLQMLTTSDQRGFDLKQLQDQRNYESPTNQLARLMGAGISRDAAIQLLSGASNANVIGSGVGSSAPGVSAPSGTAVAQQLNTAFGALQAIGSLVQLGFSIPQAISQVQMQKNAAYMSDQQRTAYDASSTAYYIMSNAGVDNLEDSISSVDSTSKTLLSLAKNGNEAALQFIKSGGLYQLKVTAPYSSPFLHALYKSERASSDYATQYSAQVRQMYANTDLMNANRDNLAVQARKMEQEINVLRAQEDYTYSLTALEEWHKELIKAQTQGQQLSNELESSWRSPEGLSMYRDKVLNGLFIEVSTLNALKDRQSWIKQADSILANYDNLIAVYELGTLYANGQIDYYNDSDQQQKDLLMFCRSADECGLFEYVNTKIKQRTAKTSKFGPYEFQSGVSTGEDILNPFEVLDDPYRHTRNNRNKNR